MNSQVNFDAALIEAVKVKKYDVVKMYLDKGAKCAGTIENRPLMHHAIVTRDSILLDICINYQFDLSTRDRDNHTPVSLAANLGQWDDVKKIISRQKETKEKYLGCGAALILAVRNNDTAMVKLLLAAGAPIDNSNLLHAVGNNDLEMTRILLHAGANPDVSSFPDWNTSLHKAVKLRNLPMIKLLLRYGADPFKTNGYGSYSMNAILYAESINFWEVVILMVNLSKKHDCYNQLLIKAMRNKKYQAVRVLLAAGASPNEKDHSYSGEGETALHIAVKDNLPAMVALLLQYGADANINNSQGVSSVVLANKLQYWDCAKAFVQPENYKSLSDPEFNMVLFYLFAAHQNKANKLSIINHDVFKIILHQAFKDDRQHVFNYDDARQQYEKSRPDRRFLASAHSFISTYKTLGKIRQKTVGQSPESLGFSEVLHDILTSGDVLPTRVAAVKAEIKKFTDTKGGVKSRAVDLLKYYKLFPTAESRTVDSRDKQEASSLLDLLGQA